MAATLLIEAEIGGSLFRDVNAKQNEGTLCEKLWFFGALSRLCNDVDTPVMQVVETRLSSV